MEMNSVVFARFLAEGLEQQNRSRRRSVNRPGVMRRLSRAIVNRVSSHLHTRRQQLIRTSKGESPAADRDVNPSSLA